MNLPDPRGPITEALIEVLAGPPRELPARLTDRPWRANADAEAALSDEDLQLALFLCYELHYRGFAAVDERWEWQPSLIRLRGLLEEPFEAAVRALVAEEFPDAAAPLTEPRAVARRLAEIVAADRGPALAKHLQTHASLAQFREFVGHRSLYHLREADPHTWGIPRLGGAAKAALVEIQIDEYGGGRLSRMHAELFRVLMAELGLDDSYGGHLAVAPALTLATNNLMSLLGLHRRHRGALLGHLAAFEMTSSLPNRRYGNGLRRLGFGHPATVFYDEHVEADAVHEQIALHDLCGSFAAAEPERAGDVLFGAAACLAVDGRWAGHLLDSWAAGRSSRYDAARG